MLNIRFIYKIYNYTQGYEIQIENYSNSHILEYFEYNIDL